MNSDTLIEIDHVTFGYDPSRTILDDISLRFARGKVTAILGGSGCGKTTLLRLIGGMAAAQRGRVMGLYQTALGAALVVRTVPIGKRASHSKIGLVRTENNPGPDEASGQGRVFVECQLTALSEP